MNVQFHSDQRENQVFTGLRAQQVIGNMLMFHVGVNMKRLVIRLKKNDSIQ